MVKPRILLRPFGLRLGEVHQDLRESILGVLKSSFSEAGYAKAIAAMRINHYLGELVQLPRIMNHYSYNFLIFGTPSTTEPWGWSLDGHHHCLNVILRGPQIVISPFFIGAEPNEIDEGLWIGTQILHKEGELGLKLMKSLPPSFQQQAQIYRDMKDAAMPEERFQKDDQRHLCGAFRDNRVIPYEGFKVSMLEEALQQQVVDILYEFLVLLPASAREKKLEQARRWLDQTYFSWIGGYTDEDPFYYRIQSPVIVLEFDHRSGGFLSNKEPAKFHIHTLMRTPNGGDYGYALRI